VLVRKSSDLPVAVMRSCARRSGKPYGHLYWGGTVRSTEVRTCGCRAREGAVEAQDTRGSTTTRRISTSLVRGDSPRRALLSYDFVESNCWCG
jgi:hypothetical protein